jgi:hypothetical protein
MNSKIAKLLLPTVAGTVVGFSTILASFGTAFATESVIITSPVKQAISNVVLYLQDSSGNFIKVKVDNFSVVHETKTYDPTNVLQKYPDYTLVAYTVKAGNNKESGMGPGEGELVPVPGSGIQMDQLPTGNATYTYEYKAIYSTSTVSSSSTTSNTVSSETSSSTQPSTVNESTVVSSETSGSTQPSTVNESTVVSSETSGSTQPSTVNESTVVSSETSGETQSAPVAQSPVISHNTQTTKPVSVPEPGTITAIALFGLGGLFTKKKLKSASK